MENDIKISDLQALCEQVFNLKKEVEDLNDEKTKKNKEIIALKSEIIKHLDSNDLDRFDSGFGTVSKKERVSVKIEDRNAFFDFLESKDLLRDSLTITAARATTIYNEYIERLDHLDDKREAMKLSVKGIPGLSQPNIFIDVSINKPRKRK